MPRCAWRQAAARPPRPPAASLLIPKRAGRDARARTSISQLGAGKPTRDEVVALTRFLEGVSSMDGQAPCITCELRLHESLADWHN